VVALLLLTPAIAWFMPADRAEAPSVALYALALGAMAAGAWASVLPRYRVGAGAVLFVGGDTLLLAEMGPRQGPRVPQVLGALTLRKRDPELRVVVNN